MNSLQALLRRAATVRQQASDTWTDTDRDLLHRAQVAEAAAEAALRAERTRWVLERASWHQTSAAILSADQARRLRRLMLNAGLSHEQCDAHLLRLGWRWVQAGDAYWIPCQCERLARPIEIARALCVAPGTVRQWLYRGRERLEPHRDAIWDLFYQAAAAMCQCAANRMAGRTPPPAVDEKPHPHAAELADSWVAYLCGNELN